MAIMGLNIARLFHTNSPINSSHLKGQLDINGAPPLSRNCSSDLAPPPQSPQPRRRAGRAPFARRRLLLEVRLHPFISRLHISVAVYPSGPVLRPVVVRTPPTGRCQSVDPTRLSALADWPAVSHESPLCRRIPSRRSSSTTPAAWKCFSCSTCWDRPALHTPATCSTECFCEGYFGLA
jgi:hypothetical protein